MITNKLLEEKWKTQRKMAKIVKYNIQKLVDMSDNIAKETAKIHGIRLKFSTRKPTRIL